MTLHSAIEQVVRSAGRPLSPRTIANAINEHALYKRGDGAPLEATQISARVTNYPGLFRRTADDEIVLAYEPDSPESIEPALLDPACFRPAGMVDELVPEEFGLYAIRARSIDALPEPFRTYANDRQSTLIYIGQATGRTLRHRFLRNELRGHGHGTFFRSIGAILGYRPLPGSVSALANKRNFRFDPDDASAIIRWINTNLEVSWLATEENIHTSEVTLIKKHTPLLNLRDNPRALPDLRALRKLCAQIAATPASAPVQPPLERNDRHQKISKQIR